MFMARRGSAVRLSILLALGMVGGSVAGRGTTAPTTDDGGPAAASDLDRHRWLEAMDDPAVRAWARERDDAARRSLERDPDLARRRDRVAELAAVPSASPPILAGERLFFLGSAPGASPTTVLVAPATGNGSTRLLVDLSSKDSNLALSAVSPSPDGRFAAYRFGVVGSGWTSWRIVDVTDGRALGETLAGARGGTLAWRRDSRSFFWTAYQAPAPGKELEAQAENQRVLLHRLGTEPSRDELVLHDPARPTRRFTVGTTDDGRQLVVLARDGLAPENEILVLDAEQPRRKPPLELGRGLAGSWGFLGGSADVLWFSSTAGAPHGRIVAFDLGRQGATVAPEPRVIVPEGDLQLVSAGVARDHFLAHYTRDAVPVYRVFDRDGRLRRELRAPQLATTFSGFVGRMSDRFAFISFQSIAVPGLVYRIDPESGELTPFHHPKLPFDPDRFTVEQIFYRAQDGVAIPLLIARRADLPRQRSAPVWMYGYGAAGWSAFPWYQPQVVAWLEMGGIYALPNIRGGGEYGAAWRRAGMREKKPQSIEDYLDAARFLISHGHTSKGSIVAHGGSLTGLLPAVAIQREPALFGAALVDIPVLDLLRYVEFASARRWIPELGDPGIPAEREVLLSYSPYHHVVSGICYPPTLVIAGELDDIAVPAHAYKYVAARGEITTECAGEASLRMAWGAGHVVGGTPGDAAQLAAEQLSFAARAVGLAAPAD